jgi:hypothetical protein
VTETSTNGTSNKDLTTDVRVPTGKKGAKISGYLRGIKWKSNI